MTNFLNTNVIGDYDLIPKNGTCLIDGDIVLHACGHVADKESASKDEAFEIIDNMLYGITERLGLTESKIFLSDSEYNFRNVVGITHIYKGNRKENSKPSLYAEMKQYMIEHLGAITAHGAEADDALGLAQTKDTVLCSIDKDLDMITGCHYNWKSNKVYIVKDFDAQVFFWKQMLTGDSTDNIKGIKGIGTVKADKMLIECEWSRALRQCVKSAYEDEFGDKSQDRFNENFSLLKISGANVNN